MREGEGEREARELEIEKERGVATSAPSFLSLWWLKLPYSRVQLCHAPPGSLLRVCSFKGSRQSKSIRSWKVISIFPRALIFIARILVSQTVYIPAAVVRGNAFAPSLKPSILQTLLYNFTDLLPTKIAFTPPLFFELICNYLWWGFLSPLSTAAGQKWSWPAPQLTLQKQE